MKELFIRYFIGNKRYDNAWLRLRLLIWGIEEIILPTLLIAMYEQDMRDTLSVFRRDSGELATNSVNK